MFLDACYRQLGSERFIGEPQQVDEDLWIAYYRNPDSNIVELMARME